MPRRPRFRGFEIGYRGDHLEASRSRVASYWRRSASTYARGVARVIGGAAAVGVAGAANLLSRVPRLNSRGFVTDQPTMRLIPYKRDRYTRDRGWKDPSKGYVQLSRKGDKHGRALTKRQKLMRYLESQMQPIVMRFQNLSVGDATNGVFPLNYNQATAGQANSYPYYIVDLTGVINYNSGVLKYPPVMHRLRRWVTTNVGGSTGLIALPSRAGQFYFSAQTGRNDSDAQNVYSWIEEEGNRDLRGISPHGKILLEKAQIELLMFGARNKPSDVTVQIVQFEDGNCPEAVGCTTETADPDAYSVSGANIQFPDPVTFLKTVAGSDSTASAHIASQQERLRQWNDFWLNEVESLIGNPLNQKQTIAPELKKRVLFEKCFKFNPTSGTSESDPNGHQVAYKLTHYINSVLSLANDAEAAEDVKEDNEYNPNRWYNDNQSLKYTCHPKAKSRRFLIIKANSYTDAVFSPNNNASFDIRVTRRHSVTA